MTAKHAVAIPGDHVRISTSVVTEPFWRAAQQRKLVACRCSDCGRFRMPPTPFCPHCQSKHVEWPALAGNGTVYSFAVCERSPFPDVADFTYVPVIVDLDDAPGARLISNIVDIEPHAVAIGMRVRVDWSPIQDGWLWPIFRSIA